MTAAPAAEHVSPRTLELRALIDACLTDLTRWVRLSGDLVDTRQAPTVPFLTPDARAARDDQVRAERNARHYNRLHGTEIPGESPAPVAVGAVSVIAEADHYLTDLCHRLVTKMRLAGICWLGEPLHLAFLYGDTDAERPDLDQLARYARDLVELVTRPARLERIHRDLEDLTTRAKRVVDGEDRSAHPDPCPHCGRRSLVVFLTLGVIRCEHDPDTGKHERCRCDDTYCPCRRGARHEWHRAERAHKHTSWRGLRRAQNEIERAKERTAMAEAALERIRALHAEIPLLRWAEDCKHADHHHDENTDGDRLCWDCPPTGRACAHCTNPDTGHQAYPCPTIQAIDEPADTPGSSS